MEWKLGRSIHVIKKVSAIRLHKNFKIFLFEIFIQVVNVANRIFPGRLDKDNQLTGVLIRVL